MDIFWEILLTIAKVKSKKSDQQGEANLLASTGFVLLPADLLALIDLVHDDEL